MTKENPPSFIHDLFRGFSCKCPNCGEGKLFSSFLKTNEQCAVCGEEFYHHRADDFPAYIVILLVGHIMVPFALVLEDVFSPPTWLNMLITIPITLALCIGLLQPVKGAIIALQWRMGMHGFKQAREKRLSLAENNQI